MTRRDGFALVTALLALVCGAALLASVALAAREEIAVSDLGRRSHVASTSAERAAWSAAAAANADDIDRPVGAVRSVAILAPPADSVDASLTRLDGDLFLAVGEAVSGGNGRYARRRVGLLVTITADSAGGVSWAPLSATYWLDLP